MSIDARTLPHRGRQREQPGFTLIEILATISLMAMVLPAVMAGISVCLSAGDLAEHHAKAASLGHTKLSQLLSEGQLQDTNLSGDFGEDWPEYRWTAQVSDWDGSALRQLDVTVWWQHEGKDRNLTFSSLAYTGGTQ